MCTRASPTIAACIIPKVSARRAPAAARVNQHRPRNQRLAAAKSQLSSVSSSRGHGGSAPLLCSSTRARIQRAREPRDTRRAAPSRSASGYSPSGPDSPGTSGFSPVEIEIGRPSRAGTGPPPLRGAGSAYTSAGSPRLVLCGSLAMDNVAPCSVL